MNTDSLLIGLIGYERDVLGAVMLSEALRPVVAEVMEDGDWVSPDHLTIWKVLRDGRYTNQAAAIANLDSRGQLDGIGGEPYIASCYTEMACVLADHGGHLEDVLHWLHECGQRRRGEQAVMERAAADIQDIRAGTTPHWRDKYRKGE